MYWPILQGVKKYLRPTTANICRGTEGFAVSLKQFPVPLRSRLFSFDS